jgi:hypothetical protein
MPRPGPNPAAETPIPDSEKEEKGLEPIEELNAPRGNAAAGDNGAAVRTVLFLCTGNYYRSRFAEVFFNHHGAKAGLTWRAVSRGLAIEFGVHNVGPLSAHAALRLRELGIRHEPTSAPRRRCPWTTCTGPT